MAETMEMSPLELAARAIYPTVARLHDFNDLGFDDFDHEDSDYERGKAFEIVRAVLLAIREPSGVMLAAGEYDDCDPGGIWFGGSRLEDSWSRMIDACLTKAD